MDQFAASTGPKPGVPMVRAVERAVQLLRAFTPDRTRLTLSELARAADLDKGTARRLLQTLMLAGLVEHDSRAQVYMLGGRVLELAAAVETGRDLRELAAPILADVAKRTNATAFLWVHHDGTALCLDRARAVLPQVEVTWFAVGARAPLNCGGGPRVMLAWLDEPGRERALALDLPKRTPTAQTDPALLRREADRIRQQGWELALDDFFVGIAGLGVPILSPDGEFIGCLSISGLTAQVGSPETLPGNIALLRAMAEEIGRKLR